MFILFVAQFKKKKVRKLVPTQILNIFQLGNESIIIFLRIHHVVFSIFTFY